MAESRLIQYQLPRCLFFTGKPYIISSDSVMPEKFRLFMEKQAMRAAIFQPVNIDNRTQMYVCFFDEKDDRSWEKI